jgi:large subunit ribosomal protein L25
MECMDKVVIKATRRTVTGKQVGVLRRQGQLPAVLYGHHFETAAVSLDLHSASITLSGLSRSSLVYIDLEGSEHAALVREKQRDFIRGTLKHVDFQVVSLTEKIRAKVPVELTGISPAVKDLNGVVVTGLNELEVECFPQFLPERFYLDISRLVKFGDGIYVRDMPTSSDVAILAHPEDMLVIITVGVGEEVEGAGGVIEPEVIEKGKKEEEAAEKK